MVHKILYATGFFEIGDTFLDEFGQQHTVTDVLLCHYLKHGNYKVLYEVDNSGEFKELMMKGVGELPTQPAKKKPTKPHLHLMAPKTDEEPES